MPDLYMWMNDRQQYKLGVCQKGLLDWDRGFQVSHHTHLRPLLPPTAQIIVPIWAPLTNNVHPTPYCFLSDP